jgi:predicted kinase
MSYCEENEKMRAKGTVILPDGKICSGKSTYSRKIRDDRGAVLLIVDEAILRVFGVTPDMEKVGEAYGKLVEYVMELAAQFAESGHDVVLESGYFGKEDRDFYRSFFAKRGIPYEWHYLEVSDETQRKNIAKRNAQHKEGESTTYYITDELLSMFNGLFNPPEPDEVDVWVNNNW